MSIIRYFIFALSFVQIVIFANRIQAESLSPQEARQISIEAYTYFYPLVTMDITRKVMTNMEPNKLPGMGPANSFHHMRAYPTADSKAVVRPNFDTLYSTTWLDLTKEPMVISSKDTSGRYFMLPMVDMWSDVFAVPGKRTTGTRSANFAVVPPQWKGTLPDGIQRIDAPTPHVWIIGRTQTNGISDYQSVHKVQDGFEITPLSIFGKTKSSTSSTPVIDTSVDMKTPPLEQVNSMSAKDYFEYSARLLTINPPHQSDWSMVARLKSLGIERGKDFNFNNLSPSIQREVEEGAKEALKIMYEKLPKLAPVINGWQMNVDTMGVYGNFYLKRAIIAMVGLGANQPEDAIYPLLYADSEGNKLTGNNSYLIHFKKEELPPVNAFWSITMYDKDGFQVPNSINRFAIGDRDNLKYNRDGSLDIYIQNQTPDADKQSNWLPSPKDGVLGITMRLYAPKAEALNGKWVPPVVKKQ